MASCTLERCSLLEWIPVFTVLARWKTPCMALCGWAVCWCQCCGSSGPWWRWGYGTGRRILWTTNTGAFYWWNFECKDTATIRAVVKSTFVESKTSPSPGLSSSSQDRVQRGSSPSQVQVQMRRSKQRKKKIIYFKTTYLIIDNLCDTRDSISSILR